MADDGRPKELPGAAAEPGAPAGCVEAAPEPEPEREREEQLTHVELESVFADTLAGLVSSDPLLADVPPAALTAEELRALTALERGTAMAVLVRRGTADRLTRVIVRREVRVRQLKEALRGAVELELARRGGRRRALSWRHVWRTHWLAFGGQRLRDDNAPLLQLGIGHKAELHFVKRIRPKRGQRDKKGGQV